MFTNACKVVPAIWPDYYCFTVLLLPVVLHDLIFVFLKLSNHLGFRLHCSGPLTLAHSQKYLINMCCSYKQRIENIAFQVINSRNVKIYEQILSYMQHKT